MRLIRPPLFHQNEHYVETLTLTCQSSLLFTLTLGHRQITGGRLVSHSVSLIRLYHRSITDNNTRKHLVLTVFRVTECSSEFYDGFHAFSIAGSTLIGDQYPYSLKHADIMTDAGLLTLKATNYSIVLGI